MLYFLVMVLLKKDRKVEYLLLIQLIIIKIFFIINFFKIEFNSYLNFITKIYKINPNRKNNLLNMLYLTFMVV